MKSTQRQINERIVLSLGEEHEHEKLLSLILVWLKITLIKHHSTTFAIGKKFQEYIGKHFIYWLFDGCFVSFNFTAQ